MEMIPTRSEKDVKRCPFCGSTAIQRTSKEFYDDLVQKYGSAMVQIECSECGASVPYFGIHDTEKDYDHRITIAMSKWNGRHIKLTRIPE